MEKDLLGFHINKKGGEIKCQEETEQDLQDKDLLQVEV